MKTNTTPTPEAAKHGIAMHSLLNGKMMFITPLGGWYSTLDAAVASLTPREVEMARTGDHLSKLN